MRYAGYRWIAATLILLLAAAASWAQEQERITAAAKERDLRIYSLMPASYNQAMADSFTRKYPFAQITYYPSRGEALLNPVLQSVH